MLSAFERDYAITTDEKGHLVIYEGTAKNIARFPVESVPGTWYICRYRTCTCYLHTLSPCVNNILLGGKGCALW